MRKKVSVMGRVPFAPRGRNTAHDRALAPPSERASKRAPPRDSNRSDAAKRRHEVARVVTVGPMRPGRWRPPGSNRDHANDSTADPNRDRDHDPDSRPRPRPQPRPQP